MGDTGEVSVRVGGEGDISSSKLSGSEDEGGEGLCKVDRKDGDVELFAVSDSVDVLASTRCSVEPGVLSSESLCRQECYRLLMPVRRQSLLYLESLALSVHVRVSSDPRDDHDPRWMATQKRQTTAARITAQRCSQRKQICQTVSVRHVMRYP